MATPSANSVPTTEINLVTLGNQSVSIQAIVDSFGVKWGAGGHGTGVTLTYSFIKSTSSFYGGYSEPFNTDEHLGKVPLTALEQTAVTSALGDWASVANVKFTLVTETATKVGEFRIGKSAVIGEQGAAGWAYLPGDFPEAGDLWLDTDPAGFNSPDDGPGVPRGSYDYSTILHELGHALGLQHPHDDGSEDVFLFGPPDPDTGLFEGHNLDLMLGSVMSYTYGYAFMPGFEPTTPMVLDIAAIQYLYGANNAYNAGNTTYNFSSGGQYNMTIWDGGGIDTLVLSGTGDSLINLNAGQASHIGSLVQYFDVETFDVFTDPRTVWIANGAKIENAKGGSGNDQILGNTLINNLQGGGGNDEIHGGAAGDTLLGQNGNDLLFGDGGVDTLDGGGGSDTLNGGAGKDIMIGGPGNDVYILDMVGETVTELAGQGGDTIQSTKTATLPAEVENLLLLGTANLTGTGNGLANRLTGNDGDNMLRGLNGKDRLDGGGGNDLLRGGGGADNFVFNDTLGAANVDTIGDFKPGLDKILLGSNVFTMLAAGPLSAANLSLTGTAMDANDYIVYNVSNGALFYDADGNGGGSAVQFATILDNTGVPPATLSDIDFIVT